MSTTLNFSGIQIGSVYATLGIASLFMPALVGIVADKWISAEKVFGLCHILLGTCLLGVSQATDFNSFYVLMLGVAIFYMPTIGLSNAICYHILEGQQLNTVKEYPRIRVWGTVGFILAAWCIDIFQLKFDNSQFYLASVIAFILGIYAFTLPKIAVIKEQSKNLAERLGLNAFVLFKDKNIAIFLFFSVLLGAALQITNIWGVPFLNDFELNFADSFAVKHPVFLMSLSQLSEVIFILLIPFFLRRYGIKKVMLISMFAWVLRFAFFAIGNPEGIGLAFLLISMLIYGLAFDFFNISGSLFIDKVSSPKIRSSAQGLFMIMVNGLGAILGGYASGIVVDYYTLNDTKSWTTIWLVFAAYALIIAVAFAFLFKYNHRLESDSIKIKNENI